MRNLLPYAYFIELLWFASALLAFILVTWMAVSTKLDRSRLKKYVDGHQGVAVPLEYYIQANGNFRAELWRVAETLGLLSASIWFAFFHSLDGKAVVFWAFWENVNPFRLLAVYLTWCKVGAGLTARWHRHKAGMLDGRKSTRTISARAAGAILRRWVGRDSMFGREPAMIVGFIAAGLALAVSFGIDVTETQIEAILKFVNAGLIVAGAAVTRAMVVPVTKVEDKGLDPKTLNPAPPDFMKR